MKYSGSEQQCHCSPPLSWFSGTHFTDRDRNATVFNDLGIWQVEGGRRTLLMLKHHPSEGT